MKGREGKLLKDETAHKIAQSHVQPSQMRTALCLSLLLGGRLQMTHFVS